MINPKQNQQIASDPNKSVWVMASAGSGKTKVLTDRILRLLLEDVNPDKILCLTYTKVASIEMQKRLNDELQKWVIIEESELVKKLENLIGFKPNAKIILKARNLLIKNLDAEFKIKIQTIHSFCQSILKSFPFEANIPINFELIDDNKSKIIMQDCQRKILQNCVFDEKLINIITKINSDISDETLNELIQELLTNKEKIYQLKEYFGDLNNDLYEYLIQKFDNNFQEKESQNHQEKFFKFIDKLNLISLRNFANHLAKSTPMDFKNYEKINKFLNNPTIDNFDILYSGFFNDEDQPRSFTKATKEKFLNELENFNSIIYEFNQYIIAFETIANSLNLIELVDQILNEFNLVKKNNGYLDYSDLINITNRMLQNKEHCEWIKLRMDSSFDHLLIDEAQDTNPIQWSIIKALTDDFFSGDSRSSLNRSIFVVGDEKQSIMGFQGANIADTKEMHDYFLEKSAFNLLDIDLNISFRSGINILKLVDKIFENPIYQQAICKIGLYKPHISYRNSLSHVEIWQNNHVINNIKKNNNKSSSSINDDWLTNFITDEDDDLKDIISKYCAYQIYNWVNDKRLIIDKKKEVNYSDIMILVRSKNSGLVSKLSHYFKKLNIPYGSAGRIKFSENLLIQDFIALAKFALLPKDCFNLACLLKSPFFNCSEEELMDLCIAKNANKTFLINIVKKSRFYEPLNKIIEISRKYNAFDFFYIILNDPSNHFNIISRFSKEALEIINNFLFIIEDFCDKQSPNLQNLLEFIDKIDPEFNIEASDNNQIKISTIHSSKGLQAPIVILPDCLYNFQKQPDHIFKILWKNNIPLWLNKKSKNNQFIKEIYDDQVKKNYEEHLRILYVALTRAEDELYIGGLSNSDNNDENKNSKTYKNWYNIINNIQESAFIYKEIENINLDNFKENNPTKNNDIGVLKNANYANFNINFNKNYNKINKSLIIGETIHKALEIIGKNFLMPKKWIENHIKSIIKNSVSLNIKDQNIILNLINNFINSDIYENIFNVNNNCKIYTEFEINFENNNYRLDFIKFTEKNILIIDYKSDENKNSKLYHEYAIKMQLYKNIITNNYPLHEIECAILWLKDLELEYLKFN